MPTSLPATCANQARSRIAFQFPLLQVSFTAPVNPVPTRAIVLVDDEKSYTELMTQLLADNQKIVEAIEECLDQSGIKMLADSLADDVPTLVRRKRFLVGAGASECVEHIRDCGDSTLQRNRLALESAGIATAIPFLVVRPSDARGQFQQR